MQNRKIISLFLILLGLAIIAVILYFLFAKKTAVTPVVTPVTPSTGQLSPLEDQKGTTTPGDKPRRIEYDITKEATHKTGAVDLEQRSAAYAERLGSYSTQSDYGNFTDLQIYMTDNFRAWADNYVAEQKAAAKSGSYYLITAKALTTEVKSFNDSAGTAEIIVTTERRASTAEIGGGEPYLQKLNISFLKVNGEWLMDAAYWEKK